jgi:hypothetical protein
MTILQLMILVKCYLVADLLVILIVTEIQTMTTLAMTRWVMPSVFVTKPLVWLDNALRV